MDTLIKILVIEDEMIIAAKISMQLNSLGYEVTGILTRGEEAMVHIEESIPTAKGDLLQQMKNCYADLEKILKHYGCSFDDVVVENVYTTDMPEFLKAAAYRNTIYKNHFPTGSWLGVKELALPEFMIEIELEVKKTN